MTGTRLGNRLVAALAVLLLLGAACANDGGSEAAGEDTGSEGTTSSTGATGEDGTPGGGYGYGGGGGGDDSDDEGGSEDGGSEITLTVNSFLFDPAELEVPSGTVITVKNANAQTPHTFTVNGTDVDLGLEPLQTGEATIDLDPGTYDFHCRLHTQMTGTLTVT